MERSEKDFEDLLRFFNNHRVRYCIVGAFAVGFHAMPRYTKDMDIWVEPSWENGDQVCKALRDFGFESLRLGPKDFVKKGMFIQLGYEPLRIDLITSIPGVSFDRAWRNRKIGRYGNQKVFFISLEDLIRNKRASGRKQDLADLELLRGARSGKRRYRFRQNPPRTDK